ncbi:hypothetical protein ACMYR3_01995 [Ampullimonas aquatilis]|uniref:hypothetical protein n=1 Tax=Ampullimonas aquatilis TaxID=1341549 RepID=UPI003C77D5AB
MALFSIFKRSTKPSEAPAAQKGSTPARRSSDSGKTPRTPRPTQPLPEEIQRIAKATREKIDAIESQMSQETNAIRISGERRPVHSLNASTPKVSAHTHSSPSSAAKSPAMRQALEEIPTIFDSQRKKKAAANLNTVAPISEFVTTMAMTGSPLEDFSMDTDFLLGNSTNINAIELAVSQNNPVIEEAAILFANGQIKAASMSLEDAIKQNTLGEGEQHGWQMLFELYQILGKQEAFESLSLDYVDRFEKSAPSWDNDFGKEKPSRDLNKEGYVAFPFKMDAGIAKQIDQIRKLAGASNSLRLDFSRPKSIDTHGATLLLMILQDLRKSKHQITLSGQDKFVELLNTQIAVERRDESDMIWRLLLEFYQLLDKEYEFEELAVNYSITYEVSPPSWESALGLVHTNILSPDEEFANTAMRHDAYEFRGEIKGKAEEELNALNQYAEQQTHLIIECKNLKRIEFSAAGLILNWLFNMRIMGKTVEMLDVSPLIVALFKVIGAQELARIEPRKF